VTKEQWEQAMAGACKEYLERYDGKYNDVVKGSFYAMDYEEQTLSIIFETMEWQINERDSVIHGGALAGMFDVAMGVAANGLAGPEAAATCDMNITFIKELEFGQHAIVKTYIVKNGRKLIRLRAEMFCQETGRLICSASGTWIPLG